MKNATRERVGWLVAGAIGMIVVGVLHAVAHLQPLPGDAASARDAMVAFTVTALGLTWSIADAFDALSLSYAALSVGVGLLDLWVLRAFTPKPGGLRGLALLNALIAAALVAVAAAHRVAPPLVLYAIALALFVVAVLRAPARS
jgi:hypothetical protein